MLDVGRKVAVTQEADLKTLQRKQPESLGLLGALQSTRERGIVLTADQEEALPVAGQGLPRWASGGGSGPEGLGIPDQLPDGLAIPLGFFDFHNVFEGGQQKVHFAKVSAGKSHPSGDFGLWIHTNHMQLKFEEWAILKREFFMQTDRLLQIVDSFVPHLLPFAGLNRFKFEQHLFRILARLDPEIPP